MFRAPFFNETSPKLGMPSEKKAPHHTTSHDPANRHSNGPAVVCVFRLKWKFGSIYSKHKSKFEMIGTRTFFFSCLKKIQKQIQKKDFAERCDFSESFLTTVPKQAFLGVFKDMFNLNQLRDIDILI